MEQVVCEHSAAARLPPGGEAGTGSGQQARPPGRDQDQCPRPSAAQESPRLQCQQEGEGQPAAEPGDDENEPEHPRDRTKNKCLIGNWLEQRMAVPFDHDEEKAVSNAIAFKDGHKGLLTTDYLSNLSNLTVYKESYPPPMKPPRETGIRKQLIEKYMYHKISKEIFDAHEAALALQPMESLTVTGRDFKVEGFKSVPRPPTMIHNYKTEQPITIWTDHATQIHGVTPIKNPHTPFRKNTSFTKPITETLDS
ncbi:sperm-associated antigen 8 isoform X1 [Chiloscyllium punctatum]|uniref:sperm-associated antigen 8 isoform X1 n=1 Tax=Chiloscyllium punctatum TaxID=137246 RepID=UPI003B63D8B8